MKNTHTFIHWFVICPKTVHVPNSEAPFTLTCTRLSFLDTTLHHNRGKMPSTYSQGLTSSSVLDKEYIMQDTKKK